MMDCIWLIDINFPETGKKKKNPGRVCWYKGNSMKQQLRPSGELLVSTESPGDFSPLLSSLLLSVSVLPGVFVSLRRNQARLLSSVVEGEQRLGAPLLSQWCCLLIKTANELSHIQLCRSPHKRKKESTLEVAQSSVCAHLRKKGGCLNHVICTPST